MASLHQRVRAIFREVFDDDDMEIWSTMAAKDVLNWDSLAQVKLIIGLEEEFGIKFSTQEVADMACVGDLTQALARKGIPE